MNALAQHVYRIASTGWTYCHGDEAQAVAAWPRLTHSALVVLDANEIYTDVWRFEGKSQYASALIEKRVRTQGLVEGEAHIVVHRLVKVPGGFQAYFSAMPLEMWQQCMKWAKSQNQHCLLMTACGLLCHGIGQGKARLLLSQRRLMCFAHTDEGMFFDSTLALGSEAAAMANAAKVLTGNQQAVLGGMGAGAVEWGVLWSEQPADAGICLQAVQAAVGGEVRTLDAQRMTLQGQPLETALPALAHKAAGRSALNPLGERLAWHAEHWVYGIAAVTLLVGLGLLGAGVLLAQQTQQQRVATLELQEQLQSLQARIAAVPTNVAPEKILGMADFAQTLDEGLRYDPLAFMAQVKAAAAGDIRIQRVQLNTAQAATRSFRVDGLVNPSAPASLSRWVRVMAASGWTLRAIDPNSVAPGAFSYDLVARVPAAKGMTQ